MKRRQGCGSEEPRETSELSPPVGVVRHSPRPDGIDHTSNSDELGDLSSSGCIADVHEPGDSVDRDVSPETLGQMQQRHKRELRVLREQAKRAGKKGKAEFKQREVCITAQHTQELAALTAVSQAGTECGSGSPHLYRRSKAQQRRERQLVLRRAEEVRVEQELAEIGVSRRESELVHLQLVLAQHGLQVFDIPADGNCMYRALAHQWQLHHVSAQQHGQQPVTTYAALRTRAAQYILNNPSIFLPFIIDAESGETPEVQLREFCTGVDGHEWGSHVELHALSESLRTRIQVFSAEYPVVEMGEHFSQAGSPTLKVCYLRHAFSAGEHYHSVIPLEVSIEQQWLSIDSKGPAAGLQ